MARPLRIEYPGAVYHISSRGNASQSIFVDDGDRNRFIALLEESINRYKWHLYAYCLMDNHYHLVLETIDGNLSKGMRHLNGVYTQSYNRRHKLAGHLFQGRYKSVLVNKNTHLLEICRYVVLHPVRKGIAYRVYHYPWSSYRATAGFIKRPDFLSLDWILLQFDKRAKKAEKDYRLYIRNGTKMPSPWNDLKGQCILGDDEFIKNLKPVLKNKSALAEITKENRYAFRPTLTNYLPYEKTINKHERDSLIREAYLEYGYTLSEIGNHIGKHYSTISKIVRNANNK